MRPSFSRLALAAYLLPALFCAAWGAEAAKPEPAPALALGQFEASGARLGMNIELALKAIAATKPQWAAGLFASSAKQDCAREGRAIADLEFTGGLVSARMDARCSLDGRGGALLQDIAIATRLAPGLTAPDIKAALVARYGPPSSESPLPGDGFEMGWTAPASSNPAATQDEYITATLTARAADSIPLALALRLAFRAKPAASADAGRARALGRLPF